MKNKKRGYRSVGEYVATFPEETQKLLEEVRATVQAVAPDASEKIRYRIGAFELHGKYLIHFAGWKNHISIYPVPAGSDAFNKKVARYVAGKGTLKFPLDEPLPKRLISQIIKYRVVALKI